MSSILQHSKPRSLASRNVVSKQHSVVTPQMMRCVIAFAFNLSIKLVLKKAPLPGLSTTTSPGIGCNSSIMSWPFSPRTSNLPMFPLSPMTFKSCVLPGNPFCLTSLLDGQSVGRACGLLEYERQVDWLDGISREASWLEQLKLARLQESQPVPLRNHSGAESLAAYL